MIQSSRFYLVKVKVKVKVKGVHLILSFIYFNLPKSLQRRDL
jgi:hypothetical protein